MIVFIVYIVTLPIFDGLFHMIKSHFILMGSEVMVWCWNYVRWSQDIQAWNVIYIVSDWKMHFFVIPLFPWPETNFNYLEKSLVESDLGFINYIVINNVNFDIIPTKQQAFMFSYTLTLENWWHSTHGLWISMCCFSCHRFEAKKTFHLLN